MLRRLPWVLVAGCLVATGCAFEYQTRQFDLQIPESAESSFVYDAKGRQIAMLRTPENRVYKRFDEIPEVMLDAVVAIEDERFWLHEGIDLRSLLRSARSNVAAGGVTEGGSTITQQYVGGVYLDRTDRTITRKLQEIALARQFERKYTKEFILEQYLNWVYLGHGANGVQAAAKAYFNKDVRELTLPEAALIAGLIQRPSDLNPFRNEEGARRRRNLVLDRMLANDFITVDEHREAIAHPVVLIEYVPLPEETYPAGHFVEEVKQWFLANPAFGETREDRLRLLFEGGLRIETTLDLDVQAAAERARDEVLPPEVADLEAAIVVMNPANGDVVAMVGGRDFFGEGHAAKVNLAMGEGRQAGSAMKAVGLAAAIDAGWPVNKTYPTPGSIAIPIPGLSRPWQVRGGAGGPNTTLVQATVRSLNTYYAQLIVELGPERLVDVARRLGIATPIAPVHAAVLGSENTTVLDMATAFSTFAARGVQKDPVFVSRIFRADGTALYEHRYTQTRAIGLDQADTITWVLQQAVSGSGATGHRAAFGRPVAGKTGTAQNNADATFIGYTPQLTTAVWVGFPEGQIPMVPPTTPARVWGGTYPAQIFSRVMAAAHEDLPVVDFPPAPPLASARPATTTTLLGDEVAVPDVRGLPADQARSTLEDAGFRVTLVEVISGEQEPGTIANQAPGPGAAARTGSRVTLEVAAAPSPEDLTVPDVVGLPRDHARSQLQAAGFSVEVLDEPSPAGNPAPNSVWQQSPGAGSARPDSGTVRIWVQPD